MFNDLRSWFVGPPLATSQAMEQRLSKKVALAVFSSDALSSVAYATEEILLVLAVAVAATGGSSLSAVVPISLAIAVLLWLVGFSYRQTIYAYPAGGGAYIVAKDNLGTNAGLIAAAALLVDYVLTVAVSATAGIAAITSATQGTSLAWLAEHKTFLCVLAIILLTVANLRGIREAGALFAVPTYLFIVSLLGMIALGLVRYFTAGGVAAAPAGEETAAAAGFAAQPMSVFLLLSAFANGCTAMTGVEAISNGVPAFQKPESRNGAITLLWMVGLLTTMFLGTSVLALLYHVEPRTDETVLSQIGRTVFPGGLSWAYFLLQATTAGILLLAANTSFADFPRLSSLMARDGFLPRQFAARGDRLVFSNGIILLAAFSCLLVIVFEGDTSRLIPLYAVGVFLSFTLSQAGMVRHWWKARRATDGANRGWWHSLLINAAGATATAVVLGVFLVTKFVHGAWVVVVVIPLLVMLFRSIHTLYARMAEQLQPAPAYRLVRHPNIVILPVTRVHCGVVTALEYALCITKDVRAIYVEVEPDETQGVCAAWDRLQTGVPLQVLPSPYRSFIGVVLDYVSGVAAKRGESIVTVLLPEFVPAHWWEEILHNQAILLLKATLLYRRGIVVTSVPFHIG